MMTYNPQLTVHSSALVAMSGGVDSAAAALLTKREGLECAGATIRLHANAVSGEADARAAAASIGIPFFVFDFSASFAEGVIERFVSAYREGRTPNPCVDCNKRIKFGRFMEKAREMGKDCIVTGHYAKVERDSSGRHLLKKGADRSKDQSYVLYTLSQDQLAYARFPLGGLSKADARELATGAGLGVSGKRESQDICFVPDGDYAKFIESHTGERARKGRFVDADGNDLGENDGVVRYTLGQRRGLGLAMPYPPYVIELRPEDGTVVVGRDGQLFSKALRVRGINLIAADRLDVPLRARVKIRYRHAEQPATVRQVGEDELSIEFDEPQRAITKGQAAVIYDGDVVVGGGTIA